MMKVEYSSNNSGGSWWVDDAGWYALEKAGWIIDWVKDRKDQWTEERETGRWLGALATSATLPNCVSLSDAVDSFESATGCCATDSGCPCCGPPHHFTLYDDNDKYIESGPNTHY